MGLKSTHSKGAGASSREGPPGKVQRKGERVRVQLCFSCSAPFPRPWGPGGCGSGQLHSPTRLCVSPPTPATWLSALRRALFLSLCQEAGDTCGDRCTIWQRGNRFQRGGGIKCSVPKGPLQPGEQLSLIPRPTPPAPWLSCTITKECCRPLEHQVLLPKPRGEPLLSCPLIHNCLLIVPLLWHLSHQIKMTCFLSFIFNQTMGSRRAENAAQYRTVSLTHLNAQ